MTNRPARRDLDEDGEDQEKRRQEKQTQPREHDVEEPLENPATAAEGNLVDGDDREAVQVLDVGFEGQQLEEVGDEPDAHRILVHDLDGLDDLRIVGQAQGDVDLLDVVVLDHPAEVLDPTEHGDPAVDGDGVARRPLVVQEALHHEAQVRVLIELLGDGDTHLSRPDDDDILEVEPPGIAALHEEVDLVPEEGDHEDDAEAVQRQVEPRRLDHGLTEEGQRPAAAVQLDDAQERDHDREGDQHVQSDVEEVVQLGPLQAAPVEALEIEDRQVDDQEQRKDEDVRLDRGDTLCDGDDVGIEPEKVRPDISGDDGHHVARHEQPDETAPMPADHFASLNSRQRRRR
jgi:hypothetical protein